MKSEKDEAFSDALRLTRGLFNSKWLDCPQKEWDDYQKKIKDAWDKWRNLK